MSYDATRSAPSAEAHGAAASLDAIYEALSDGIDLSDIGVMVRLSGLFSYLFESGLPKGELISRVLQVIQLVERDNSLLSSIGVPNEPVS